MKLSMLVEPVARCLCTKFEPFPVAGFCVRSIWSFSVACTRPCPSVYRLRGFPGGWGMKLGTLVEHVRRCLYTKFEPFPVAGFCVRSIWLFSVVCTRLCPSVYQLRGFPGEAGNETWYVGRTCQEVSVYNSVANSLHDDRCSSWLCLLVKNKKKRQNVIRAGTSMTLLRCKKHAKKSIWRIFSSMESLSEVILS